MAGSATGAAQGIGDSSVALLPQNDRKQRVQGFGSRSQSHFVVAGFIPALVVGDEPQPYKIALSLTLLLRSGLRR